MSWTAAQTEAIQARGGNLLLAAAAGSGKTAVLVERMIRRILDPQEPVAITDILVMTFTRAAAQEMRLRIGTALAAAQAENPSPYLERQLALLGSAQISTIHSFCQTVIRQYFYRVDVDAGYRQGTDSELALGRLEVLDATLADAYATATPSFVALAESMRRKQSDKALRQAILALYEYSRSLPFPQDWLETLPAAYTDDAARLQTLTVPLWRSWQDSLAGAAQRLMQAAQRLDDPALTPWREVLIADAEMLEEIMAAPDWNAAYAAVGTMTFVRWPGKKLKDGILHERKEEGKKIRDAVKKKVIASVTEMFGGHPDTWGAELAATRPQMESLVALTTDFATRFAAYKKKERIIDFSDLEHLCLSLLLAPDSTPDKPRPSVIAREIAAQYAEVMVDEYQDTNAVQELIASLVSRENNRFMVGDVKQSIYRFRLADPGIFLAKYGSYRDEADAPCRRILLNRNFRSDGRILTAVNDVFRTVMQRPLAELDYGDEEALYPGRVTEAPPVSWVAGPVAVRVVTGESDETQEAAAAQAEAIAQEILTLRRRGVTVAQKDGTQMPLRWRDIVILLRSVQTRAECYVDALRAAGIPVFSEQAGGYFAATEVALLLSLLTVIDNPYCPTEVMAVLRSPLGGWNEDELAALAIACREMTTASADVVLRCRLSQMTALRSETVQRTQRLLAQFDVWRESARTGGVAPLIRRIYEDTGYAFYVGGLPEGDVRRANLEALYRRAAEFDDSAGGGLTRFVRYLQRLQHEEQDLSIPSVIGEGEDAVRIMTIHKSKGLEFPVVFVAEMQREFNRNDWQGPVLLHRDLGAGIVYYDPARRLTYPTVLYRAVKARLAQESLAEEQRLLYVAMTRARDRLYLYRYAPTGTDPMEQTPPAQATCYWDWLAAALARYGDHRDIWEMQLVPAAASDMAAPSMPDERMDAVRRGEPTGTVLATAPTVRLAWTYPDPEATGLPAKMTVTELQRQIAQGADMPPLLYPLQARQTTVAEEGDTSGAVRLLATAPTLTGSPTEAAEEWAAEWRVPAFLTETPEVLPTGGTDYGTLVHRIMERIGRERVTTDNFCARLDAWVAAGILTPEERQTLSVKSFERWLQSPLYARIRAAAWAQFECPFGRLVPACELLPGTAARERIFLQGVIDCIFAEGDELVIVDYKTDRVDHVDVLREKYREQLELYRTAAEHIWQRRVKSCVLYSYRLGETVAWQPAR